MLTSSAFWVWKESGGGWGLWEGDFGRPGHQLQPERVRILSRPRPLAVAGRMLSTSYDPAGPTLRFSAAGPLAGVPAV